MSTLDTLIAARDLIASPDHWCQDQLYDAERNAHCALGALCYVTADPGVAIVAEDALDRAMAEIDPKGMINNGIGWFNDHHTHDEVLRAFDTAIDHERHRTR